MFFSFLLFSSSFSFQVIPNCMVVLFRCLYLGLTFQTFKRSPRSLQHTAFEHMPGGSKDGTSQNGTLVCGIEH